MFASVDENESMAVEERVGSDQAPEPRAGGPRLRQGEPGPRLRLRRVRFRHLAPPGTLVVSFGLMIPAVALLASALQDANKRRRALPLASDKERELLSAIRDNGGVITPTEAAMETSLTVKEADRMLSELAGGGHLSVESAGGTLCYSLPGRQATELDEPSSAT